MLGARRADRIQALADELTGAGGTALAVATDVTDRDQVQHLVDATVQTYGRIDVLINNAGLMPHSPLERLKVDDWDQMIDVHLKGVLYGIAAALPYMKEQKAGHFINVSSVAGHKVRPGGVVYAATKHAVRVLTEGLRMEVKPYNIRTTVISPGAVATELPNSVTEPDVAQNIQQVLCGVRAARRFVRPDGRLRYQPAGGGGCERDPVSAHAPGTVSARLGRRQCRNTPLEFELGRAGIEKTMDTEHMIEGARSGDGSSEARPPEEDGTVCLRSHPRRRIGGPSFVAGSDAFELSTPALEASLTGIRAHENLSRSTDFSV